MTKRIEEELNKTLAELRQEHRQTEAPLFLETRLRASVRDRRSEPSLLPLVWRWALATLAIVVIGMLFWRINRPKPEIVLEAQQEQQAVPAPKAAPEVSSKVPPVPNVKDSQNAAQQGAGLHSAKTTNRPVERVTAFVALPESEVLPEPAEESVYRTSVRGSELRRYGFDVSPAMSAQLVRADFLVGEDGLARAVRLVQ